MRWMATAAAMIALVVSACGNVSERGRTDNGAGADGLPTTVDTDGVYEAGVDIAPGVYTTEDLSCLGYAASTADDIEDMDDDAFFVESAIVGDLRRIVIRQGEFFTSSRCGTWQREDDAKPKSADPATLTGGCDILVGEDALAQQALTFPRNPESAADGRRRYEIQERLSTVVIANRQLAKPAGQLVDFLDDPEEYVEGGTLDADVTQAMADIRKACRNT